MIMIAAKVLPDSGVSHSPKRPILDSRSSNPRVASRILGRAYLTSMYDCGGGSSHM